MSPDNILPTPSSFCLNKILIVPHLVKNLIFVCQFSHDNSCSIEFDPYGFFTRISVRGTRFFTAIVMGNSTLSLLLPPPSTLSYQLPPPTMLSYLSLHHRSFGTNGWAIRAVTLCPTSNGCNKATLHVYHACQLGKHVCLPFSRSLSCSSSTFELVHCDLWISLVLSNSGFQYYLVILDDFTHFIWTFPLRKKYEVCDVLLKFAAHVQTQFTPSLAPFMLSST